MNSFVPIQIIRLFKIAQCVECGPFVRSDALRRVLMKTQISWSMNSCRGTSSPGLFERWNWLQKGPARSIHIFRKGHCVIFQKNWI